MDAKKCRRRNKTILRAKWKNAPDSTYKEKFARAKLGRRYMINSFFVRDATKRQSAIRKLKVYKKGAVQKRAIKLLKGGKVQLWYTGAGSYKVCSYTV